MTPRAPSPTVEGVKLPADLPMRNFPLRERRSPVLRLWGIFALGVIFFSIFTTKPYPGLSGDGAWVTVGVVLLAAGVALSMPRRELPAGRRFVGLCLVSVAGIVLLRFQPHGAGFACLYYVMAIAGLRLATRPAVIAWGIGLGGELIVIAARNDHPWSTGAGLVFATLPWYLITRLVRRLADRHAEAEEMVEELRESRAARGRVGRAGRAQPRGPRHARRARPLAVRAGARSSRARGCSPRAAVPTPRWSRGWSARTTSRPPA